MAFSFQNQNTYKTWMAVLLCSTLFGCLTKATQLSEPLHAQDHTLAAVEETVGEPGATEPTPQPPESTEPTGNEAAGAPYDRVDLAAKKSEVPEPADPREQLEEALETTREATEQWKKGKLDEALDKLDLAYETLLHIDEQDNAELLQGKEDLRLMISKRIVEIYASRRTTAGSLEKAIPIVFNEHVEREIKSFQGREKRFFQESYARSGMFRPMILEELRKEGMPEQLSWLPLIESGFKTNALSRARALGPWQFIPSTGYRYGLNRDNWVDERMDPEKSTRAAIAYLHELHDMFGDWMSALAGYNCGEARVMRAIKSQRINYLDNFWDLYNKLPRETARYVPRFLATLIILDNPDKYGIELPPLMEPMAYENLEVHRSLKLADLDQLAAQPKGTFHKLNPELRYKATPEKAYALKVPVSVFAQVSADIHSLKSYQIPANSYAAHRVRRGETLSTIARKYKSSVSAIMRANNLRNQHRIKQGQRLKIPGRDSALRSTKKTPKSVTKTHTVRRGDSLWMLARKYRTTVDSIKALNNLKSNNLSLGQTLVLSADQKNTGSARTYKVKRGDTLAKIAAKHKVNLGTLMRANNLTKRDKIYPKQTLIVPAG